MPSFLNPLGINFRSPRHLLPRPPGPAGRVPLPNVFRPVRDNTAAAGQPVSREDDAGYAVPRQDAALPMPGESDTPYDRQSEPAPSPVGGRPAPTPGGVVQTGPNQQGPGTIAGPQDPADLSGPGDTASRRGWQNLNLDRPQGRGGYGRLEGFNTDRAFAGGDPNSVKDGFARWITGLGFDPTQADEATIEATIRQNLGSARQYGLNILDVRGDKILIETAERGPEWVDVVRGAGGGDAAWQWLTEENWGDGGGQAGDAGAGAAINQLRGMPGGASILEALLADDALSGDSLFRRIQAELQALLTGRPASNPNAPVPVGQ